MMNAGLQNPYLSDQDMFNTDALIASSEKTAFVNLRAAIKMQGKTSMLLYTLRMPRRMPCAGTDEGTPWDVQKRGAMKMSRLNRLKSPLPRMLFILTGIPQLPYCRTWTFLMRTRSSGLVTARGGHSGVGGGGHRVGKRTEGFWVFAV